MARTNFPSDKQDQFMLRMPDGMRDRLKAEAARNKRSLNAEIVARLEDFEQVIQRLMVADDLVRHHHENARLLEARLAMAENQIEAHKIVERRLDARQAAIPRDQTLYVAIDAAGKPISWQEISAHINAITHAGNLEITKIDARIFDPKLVSNNKRENAWWELVQYYRERGGRAAEDQDEG